jgi:hypothetical protein
MRRLGLLIGLLWWLAYADSYQPLLNHERMTQLFIEMARLSALIPIAQPKFVKARMNGNLKEGGNYELWLGDW